VRFIDGQILTADQLNALLEASTRTRPAIALGRSSDLSVGTSWTTIIWQTELVDTDGLVAVPASTVSLGRAGIYLVSAHVQASAYLALRLTLGDGRYLVHWRDNQHYSPAAMLVYAPGGISVTVSAAAYSSTTVYASGTVLSIVRLFDL